MRVVAPDGTSRMVADPYPRPRHGPSRHGALKSMFSARTGRRATLRNCPSGQVDATRPPPHVMGVPDRCHSRRMGNTLASTARVDATRSPSRGLQLDSSSSLIGRGSTDARRGSTDARRRSIECPPRVDRPSAEDRGQRSPNRAYEIREFVKSRGPRDLRAEGLALRVASLTNGIPIGHAQQHRSVATPETM